MLYGEKGVGKSRLLQHFCECRVSGEEVVLVRLDRNGCYSLAPLYKDNFPQEALINQLIGSLADNSTLIIDQLDKATEETQGKILRRWSAEALLKGLRLVISVDKNSLSRLTQLSQRLHLAVEAVALKPLTDQERLEYLRASCCAGLRQQLVLSVELKKQLKLTGGIFSQLKLIPDQFGVGLGCRDAELRQRFTPPRFLLYGVMLLLLVFLLDVFDGERWIDIQVRDWLDSPKVLIVDIPEVQPLPIEPYDLLGKDAPVAVAKLPADDEVIPVVTAGNITHASVELEAVIDPPIVDRKEVPGQSFFENRLMATRHWLATADNGSTSIQIMTIAYSDNPQQSLTRYLKRLESRQLDLDKVMIFPVNKRGEQMYGVLYGQFNSMRAAYAEIERLPAELKANKPIARTVKGVKDEIDD